MAIAYPHVRAFMELRKGGAIGEGRTNSILELGEQNWFGDLAPSEIHHLIDMFYQGEAAAALKAELDTLIAPGKPDIWALARFFYKVMLNYQRHRAIDLHGTSLAEPHDLNLPVPIDEQFDLVMNIGTSEHVFNQYQVFKTVHERTRPGGLMLHALPNQGAYDHGFYNYHPTLFHDLAAANNYHLVMMVLIDGKTHPPTLHGINGRADYVKRAVAGQLSDLSGVLTVFQKPAPEAPFQLPQQGYYNNSLPPELAEAWKKLPR